MNNGRYQQCYDTLGHATILPFEGQSDVYNLFADCQMALALEAMKQGKFAAAEERLQASKEYPEHLGTGKPAESSTRVQDYLLMLCYQKSSDTAKADERKAAIDAWAARNSKENWAKLSSRFDSWYAKGVVQPDPLTALRNLTGIVQGGGKAE